MQRGAVEEKKFCGHGCRARRPALVTVDLHGDTQSIVNFDAQIAHGALQLRVSEQKLNHSQIPSALPGWRIE
jgi:hypothetical protein